jgi:hypothetical protein
MILSCSLVTRHEHVLCSISTLSVKKSIHTEQRRSRSGNGEKYLEEVNDLGYISVHYAFISCTWKRFNVLNAFHHSVE